MIEYLEKTDSPAVGFLIFSFAISVTQSCATFPWGKDYGCSHEADFRRPTRDASRSLQTGGRTTCSCEQALAGDRTDISPTNQKRSNRRFVASLCNFLFQKEKVRDKREEQEYYLTPLAYE